MERPEPEALEHLRCPRCRRALFPIILPPHQVSFQCDRGHSFTCEKLLVDHSKEFLLGLDALLSEWEEMLRMMAETADDASRNGYLAIGEIFDRQVYTMARRIDTLQGALAKCIPKTVVRKALRGA